MTSTTSPLPETSLRAGIVFSNQSAAKRQRIADFQAEAKANGWEVDAMVADDGGIYLSRYEPATGFFGRINRGNIDSDGNFFQWS